MNKSEIRERKLKKFEEIYSKPGSGFAMYDTRGYVYRGTGTLPDGRRVRIVSVPCDNPSVGKYETYELELI